VPRFPADSLEPKRGVLRALLFENRAARVRRDVYFSVEVEFAPLTYGPKGERETFDCSARVDWLELALRDWRALDGLVVDGGAKIDASFYMTEHDPAARTKLRVSERRGARFLVELELRVRFHGFFGGDKDPALPVAARLRVPFDGLTVQPELLAPTKANLARVEELAAPFIDRDAYEAPALRTNKFGVTTIHFPPRAG
jgi:hypothetical protein